MPDETPAPGPESAPTPPATAPPAEPKDDWETRFKYLLADFENFRRRTAKEKEATTQQARGALLRELLAVVEAFQAATRSVGHLPAKDPLRRGIELLDREWTTFLRHEGVEPVAEVGRTFRSEEEEAIGEAPPTDACPEGSVTEVVQQGYRYFGGLLRPAKVIVARSPPPSHSAAPVATEKGEGPEAES